PGTPLAKFVRTANQAVSRLLPPPEDVSGELRDPRTSGILDTGHAIHQPQAPAIRLYNNRSVLLPVEGPVVQELVRVGKRSGIRRNELGEINVRGFHGCHTIRVGTKAMVEEVIFWVRFPLIRENRPRFVPGHPLMPYPRIPPAAPAAHGMAARPHASRGLDEEI